MVYSCLSVLFCSFVTTLDIFFFGTWAADAEEADEVEAEDAEEADAEEADEVEVEDLEAEEVEGVWR